MIGVVSAPLLLITLSAMTGDLFVFMLVTILQVILVGGTTIATTYSRLIAQQFNRSRGLALAIVACAPAAAGAIIAPLLASFIDINGWRAGYIAIAIVIGLAGLVALVLIQSKPAPPSEAVAARVPPGAPYRAIFRNPAFQLVIAGMFLCHLPYAMQTSQLKVILLDRGIDSADGTLAIALFALSVIVGRLVSGIALDRFPAPVVAAVFLGLPGIGLSVLASGLTAFTAIAAAVFMLGLSYGGGGTMVGYLAMRYFKLEIYSTVLGIIIGSVALSASLGALLLSLTLKITESYTPFLVLSAAAAVLGGSMFLLLSRISASEQPQVQ
jgi:MFS family permease